MITFFILWFIVMSFFYAYYATRCRFLEFQINEINKIILSKLHDKDKLEEVENIIKW